MSQLDEAFELLRREQAKLRNEARPGDAFADVAAKRAALDKLCAAIREFPDPKAVTLPERYRCEDSRRQKR